MWNFVVISSFCLNYLVSKRILFTPAIKSLCSGLDKAFWEGSCDRALLCNCINNTITKNLNIFSRLIIKKVRLQRRYFFNFMIETHPDLDIHMPKNWIRMIWRVHFHLWPIFVISRIIWKPGAFNFKNLKIVIEPANI